MTAPEDPGGELSDPEGSGSPKLIRGPGLKARVAAACVAVLTAGALFSPRSAREAPPPQEKVAPILQAEADRREPARVFRGLQETGRRVAAFSVSFHVPVVAGGPSFADFVRPAATSSLQGGFGIVVSEDRVLTHIAALAGQAEPTLRFADGGAGGARVVGYEPETGLVLLSVENPGRLEAAALSAAPPVPGELALAAARSDGGDLLAPVFIASSGPDRHSITIGSDTFLPGTPIFNLEGEALAVAAGGPSGAVAYPVGDAVSRLTRLADEGRGLPPSIGVFLQAITPALAPIFGEGGVLLSDVADGSAGARAALAPGDVVVRIAGVEVSRVEDALERIAASPPGVSASLVVRRRGRESEFQVVPRSIAAPHLSPPPPPAPLDAPLARALLPPEALGEAGIPEDAILLAVQGAPVTARTAPLALRRAKPPVLLRLQHDERRFFAALAKAR